MATDNSRPMSDADIVSVDTETATTPAPLKAGPTEDGGLADTGSAPAMPMGNDLSSDGSNGKLADARQAAREGATKMTQQATDKVRLFAEDGKSRAGGALDQLSQMLNDAAQQVEDKLGANYAGYARQAAGTVQGFSDQVKNKDVDALVEDVRGFVRKSPAVAIGVAAAVGFALARLVQAGLDDNQAQPSGTGGTQPDTGQP